MSKETKENNSKKASTSKKSVTSKKSAESKKTDSKANDAKTNDESKKLVTKKAEFAVGSLVLDHRNREYTVLEMPEVLDDYSKIVLEDSQGNTLIRLKLKLKLK
jgi:hypothetical protein